MNATHLRIISCPGEGGEMTGYNPDQQPKCRLTESAFRDDSHKRYTLVEREDVASGKTVQQVRLTHAPGAVRRYLARCTPGTAVALEAPGHRYWSGEELRQARPHPRLVHSPKAQPMVGLSNNAPKLEMAGLNRLQRKRPLPPRG